MSQSERMEVGRGEGGEWEGWEGRGRGERGEGGEREGRGGRVGGETEGGRGRGGEGENDALTCRFVVYIVHVHVCGVLYMSVFMWYELFPHGMGNQA